MREKDGEDGCWGRRIASLAMTGEPWWRGGSKPPPYRGGTIPGVAERSESSNKMLAGGKHTATSKERQ